MASDVTARTETGQKSARRLRGEFMRYLKVLCGVGMLFWLAAAVMAQAQTSRADSAGSYLERGNEWMKKGDVERALADYDLAIASDPLGARAYNNRGVARQRKGD